MVKSWNPCSINLRRINSTIGTWCSPRACIRIRAASRPMSWVTAVKALCITCETGASSPTPRRSARRISPSVTVARSLPSPSTTSAICCAPRSIAAIASWTVANSDRINDFNFVGHSFMPLPFLQDPCRVADHDSARGHALGNDRAHSNRGPAPDAPGRPGFAWEKGGAPADIGAVFDGHVARTDNVGAESDEIADQAIMREIGRDIEMEPDPDPGVR